MSGRQIISTELTSDAMGEWPNASIEAVRDAILDGRMTAVALAKDEQREQEGILTMLQDAAVEAVTAGRMIDAGYLPNAVIQAEAKRAKDLILDGWIGHPFRLPYVIFHTWEEGAAPLLVMPDPEGSVRVQICELTTITLQGERALLMGDFGELSPAQRDEEAGFQVRAKVSPLRRLGKQDGLTDEAMMKAAACNLGDPVWTVLAMLATDGVEVQTIEPPHRLNRQRAAKGKRPIPGRRCILSGPYVTAIQNRLKGRAKGDAGTGHHASPVMHIRRGHPRTLTSGRRVWVRDTIVNAKEDAAPPAATRSHYRIET